MEVTMIEQKLGPVANQAEWNARYKKHLQEAKLLTISMSNAVIKNEFREAANKEKQKEQASRIKEEAEAKVKGKAKKHQSVINTCFDCMETIFDKKLQTEAVLTKLRHERMAQFAAMQVSNRRIEVREKRPAAEHFVDKLTGYLQAEKSMLEKSRVVISDLEERGKKILDELEAMRAYLSRDTGERRLEMAHDLSSLKPDLSIKPSSAHASTAEAAAEPAPAAEGAPPAEEGKQSSNSGQLIQETIALLAKSDAFKEDGMKAIDVSKKEAAMRLDDVERALAKRTSELAEAKKLLEQNLLDVEACIESSQRSLNKSIARADPKDKDMMEKLAKDQELMKKLFGHRDQLREDIRNKFAALEIDNVCRRVTPCKADAAKNDKKKGMQRSQSAGSIRKKEEFAGFGTTPMPGSPAGGSDVLRGAGAAGLK